MRYVAYYRVSTSKQQRSGLGLAGQRAAIETFLTPADELVSEFIEAVSGNRDDREQLQLAIKAARRSNAKLLIAKLDRFSRRVSFIARMMESDVGLVVADMPHASEFQLHIFAALAQEERRLISQRTKSALLEAKKRGKLLGSNGKVLAQQNKSSAAKRALEMQRQLPSGWDKMSFSAVARHLNCQGSTTACGGRWYAQSVKNLVLQLNTLEHLNFRNFQCTHAFCG